MIPPRSDKRSWVRKLDGSMHVVGADEQPQQRWYPGNLSELLYIVTKELPKAPGPEGRVCGSHWGISKVAVSHGHMIEMATPVHEEDDDQAAPRLNKPLYEVIPACMSQDALYAFMRQDVKIFDPTVMPLKDRFYLFHVEAGMRIYELYSHLDSGDDGKDERSLAWYIETHRAAGQLVPSYLGPWALPTMGGAGGQTIGGVISTATHGGDVGASAISDAIVAIHLIAPDGQEYWIERKNILPYEDDFALVDQAKLETLYAPQDNSKPGGAFREKKIVIKRDDDLMNAAIVSCGRMGIIYSVVVRAIRQFALREELMNPFWEDVRTWLTAPTAPVNVVTFANHFVQVDVDMYPKPVFDWSTASWLFGTTLLGGLPLALVGLYAGIKGNEYRTWVLVREFLPLNAANHGSLAEPRYYGREERSGANKGAMPPLAEQGQGSFRNPCGGANWLRQFLQDTKNILTDIRNDAAKQWLAAGAAAAFLTITAPPLAAALYAYQGVLQRVMLFCQAWIFYFSAIQEILPEGMKFGDFVSALLNTFSDLHAHSIVQLMYWAGANSQHPAPITAISYAVMDTHNYQNKGCIEPGDSIEFFIDANSQDLVSFIDYALDAVRDLASEGEGFGGYISMRFMKDCPSFLAMQRWPRTCSIEIAGLSKVDGCGILLQRLEQESLNRDIILHWGQRNNRAQLDLEKVFGPWPGGPFHRWRDALSVLSEHGRLDNFSTPFSRYKGLEITEPRLYALTASLAEGCEHETTTIKYDAFNNPPETILTMRQRFADGRSAGIVLPPGKLRDSVQIPLGRGRSTVELDALRILNDNKYVAPTLSVALQGFASGDFWDFAIDAESRQVDGVDRWYVEINRFSQTTSSSLRVSALTFATPEGGEWILRNPDVGADLLLTPAAPMAQLPAKPVFNRNWRFFSKAPTTAFQFPPPKLYLRFTMYC